MRVFYDGQIYTLHSTGGIIRYFNSIISRLPDDYCPILTSVYHSSRPYYPEHQNLKVFEFPQFRPYRVFKKVSTQYFRYITSSSSFDIAHPTYYSLMTGQGINNYTCPVILTVHDMIHELFPEYVDSNGQYADLKRRAISASQAILCVSQNTKKDLIERYFIPEERITVTYLASGIDSSLSYGSEVIPKKPYYLYVGSRAKYKNFDGLLIAFSKVASVNSEIILCVVGSAFNSDETKLINDLRLVNRIEHYGQIADRHLAKLYRCSIAFVYPSFYEGFGIPPLEAMSCGTAVVASNTSSLPEVVADAGLLFDPKAVHDLADILLLLLENSTERDRLVVKGYERIKAFSWDKTVAQTLGVYRALSN